MVEHILDCIADSARGREVKIKALEELRSILEKLELGIEAVSREGNDCTSQLEDIKYTLENTKIELSYLKKWGK
jgi:hypothetical protein